MSARPEKTYSPSVTSRSRGGRWSWRATRAPFWSDEAAGVRRQLAGEHPQQGRLAGAVAAGERHPLARLELEGDVGEQQLAADVDVEGCRGRDRHRPANLDHRHRRNLDGMAGPLRHLGELAKARATQALLRARRRPGAGRARGAAAGAAGGARGRMARRLRLPAQLRGARRSSSTPTSRACRSADLLLRRPTLPDPAALDRFVNAPGEVAGVLVGHTHFDHAVDAPAIAGRFGCRPTARTRWST